MDIFYCHIDTLVGKFLIAGTETSLYYTSFSTGISTKATQPAWINDRSPLKASIEQFEAYFAGELTEFDIEHTIQGTSFQNQVWEALKTVPFGCTASYGDIAKLLDNPGASQAVGAANGANPLPVLIPCHRIIGADGSLTGFGGGLQTKHILLHHEGIATAEDQLQLF